MKHALYASLFGLFTFLGTTVFAQPGTLDINFNGNGKLILDLGLDEFASAMVIQDDQKILLTGFHGSGSVVDFHVTRLNPDGSLDNTFGTNGTVITDFSASIDVANDMVLQADGKILVSGFSNAGATITMALARYMPDGTLDPDFGIGGKTVTTGSYDNAVGQALHLQSDGKILMCGYYNNGVNNDMIVARFNSDGTLDNTFSFDGFSSYDVGGLNDGGYVVRQQSDGKILVAGNSSDPATSDKSLNLVRFETDGMIDLGFGTNGLVETDFGSTDVNWNDMRVLSNDKILLVGYAQIWGTKNMSFAKHHADGTLDTDFGSSGTYMHSFAPLEPSEASSLFVSPDGRIVVAGSSGDLTTSDLALAMFGYDGTEDPNFGVNGGVTTDFASDYDRGYSVAMQDDGLIVVAGAAFVSGAFDIAVSRYISGINIGIGEVSTYIGSTLIYPNPILDRTARLEYSVSEGTDIYVQLFSTDGKHISTLIPEQFRMAGDHTETLALPDVATGSYLLRIGTEVGFVTVRMIIE